MRNDHLLSPLQQVLLNELKWFDCFCSQHNLTYYAIGGTLLGAMRHNGFIPWDDDIDLGMPRKDYNRLVDYSIQSEKYMIETHKSNREDYCYPYMKIYDTHTTLIEHKRVNVTRGVFIDVFPIDGIGDTLKESNKNYKEIKRLYHFYLSVVAGIRKGRAITKNIAVIVARLIPFSFRFQSKMRQRLNTICSRRENQECKFGGNLLGAYGEREIVEMSLFGAPQRLQFEDMLICCPSDSDGYLTRIYGSWRTLPPPEKRISHHDFDSIDLEHPFFKNSHM